jgi:hypothetical protein
VPDYGVTTYPVEVVDEKIMVDVNVPSREN